MNDFKDNFSFDIKIGLYIHKTQLFMITMHYLQPGRSGIIYQQTARKAIIGYTGYTELPEDWAAASPSRKTENQTILIQLLKRAVFTSERLEAIEAVLGQKKNNL
jgi:hypothetical protein